MATLVGSKRERQTVTGEEKTGGNQFSKIFIDVKVDIVKDNMVIWVYCTHNVSKLHFSLCTQNVAIPDIFGFLLNVGHVLDSSR